LHRPTAFTVYVRRLQVRIGTSRLRKFSSRSHTVCSSTLSGIPSFGYRCFPHEALRRLCKSIRLYWPRATFPTLAGGFLFPKFYGNCGTKFPKIDRERDDQSLSYSYVITGDLLETRKWCRLQARRSQRCTRREL
jgi:hypothetical protein